MAIGTEPLPEGSIRGSINGDGQLQIETSALGLVDGQSVLYRASGATSILGLTSGRIYYIKSVQEDTNQRITFYLDSNLKQPVRLAQPSGETHHQLFEVFEADGGEGNDRLISYIAGDAQDADRANALLGGGGDDVIVGGLGTDYIDGGDDADRIFGDGAHSTGTAQVASSDVILGGDGDDRLYGNRGDDNLSGGVDADTLVGGAGSDVVLGGPGKDTLAVIEAGSASDYDQLLGGENDDRYQFAGGWGVASIGETGDTKGIDTIDLSEMSGDYVHVMSNGTLFSTQGDLYGDTITAADSSKIKLNVNLNDLKSTVKSPGQVITESGFGLHQVSTSDGTKAIIEAVGQLPKDSGGNIVTSGPIDMLLWVDRGDGPEVHELVLEELEPTSSVSTSLRKRISASETIPLSNVDGITVFVVNGRLKIEVTAEGTRDASGNVVAAQAEIAVKAPNTVVAGLGAKKGFENIEAIKTSSGANTFVFGNDYWQQDIFGKLTSFGDFFASFVRGLSPINTGSNSTRSLKINTSVIANDEPGKGQPLVIDLRTVNTKLEFFFSPAATGTGARLTIRTAFDANVPVVDFGPVFRYNGVEFSNVGNDTVIYTGRFDNTITFEQGVTFNGTLVASEGHGISAASMAGRPLDVLSWAGNELVGERFFNYADAAADINTLLFQVKNTLKYSQTALAGGVTRVNVETLKTQDYSLGQQIALQGINLLTSNPTPVLDLPFLPTSKTSGLNALASNLGSENEGEIIVKTGVNFVRGNDWDPLNSLVSYEGNVTGGGVAAGLGELAFRAVTTLLDGSDTISVGDAIHSVTPGIHILAGGSGADTYKFRTQLWGGAVILEPPRFVFESDVFANDPSIGTLLAQLGIESWETTQNDTLDFSALYQDLYFTVFNVSDANLGIVTKLAEASGMNLDGTVREGMTMTLVSPEDPYDSEFWQKLIPLFDNELDPDNPASGSLGDLFDTTIANFNWALAFGIESIIGGRGNNTVKLVNGATLEGQVVPGFGGSMNLDYSLYGNSVSAVDLGANLDIPIGQATYSDNWPDQIASLFPDVTNQWGTADGIGGIGGSYAVSVGKDVIGTEFDDVITGNDFTGNTLQGLGGNDSLSGKSGDDLLVGGPGDDTLDGGAGVDVLIGDDGHDSIVGGPGDDTYLPSSPSTELIAFVGGSNQLVVDANAPALEGAGTEDDPWRTNFQSTSIHSLEGIEELFIGKQFARTTSAVQTRADGRSALLNDISLPDNALLILQDGETQTVVINSTDMRVGTYDLLVDPSDKFDLKGHGTELIAFTSYSRDEDVQTLRFYQDEDAKISGGIPNLTLVVHGHGSALWAKNANYTRENPLVASEAGSAETPVTVNRSNEVVEAIIEQAQMDWHSSAVDASGEAPGTRANEVDDRLAQFEIQVVDLPGNGLAQVSGTTIGIDRDAAGHGWFIDPTPGDLDDDGFSMIGPGESRFATSGEIASQYDLLTVLRHEFGHALGLADRSDDGDLMNPSLAPGTRIAITLTAEEASSIPRTMEEGGLDSERSDEEKMQARAGRLRYLGPRHFQRSIGLAFLQHSFRRCRTRSTLGCQRRDHRRRNHQRHS